MTLQIRHNSMCQYEGCIVRADLLAYNRLTKQVGRYCEKHAHIIADYDHPEYVHGCANCGCLNPVN